MAQMKGVVTGRVVSTKDPDGHGRVQVSFPFLGGQNDSYWAPVATLLAGAGHGAWFMPEKDDEVLVAFNQDDVAHPFILGFLWNGKQKPPEKETNSRVIHTPGGHTLRFDDGNPKKIVIQSSSGLKITLDDSGAGAIKLEGGGRRIEMSNNTIKFS